MDIWVLDNEFDKIALVENFTSFIWTERYKTLGDCKVVYPENRFNSDDVRTGRYIHLPQSKRLMVVNSINKSKNDDDEDVIAVDCESVETWLKNRGVTPTSSTGNWIRTGMSPGDVAADLVRRICVDGTGAQADDVIPGMSWSQPDPGTFILDVELRRAQELYSVVKELCDSDDMGFRIMFDIETKAFNFKVYRGTDRSSSGLSHPMVFSPEYDNLHNTRYLRSQKDYKNTAYVVHKDRADIVVVNRPGAATRTGITRRVLMVDGNEVEGGSYDALLELGRRRLFEHNYQTIFDGEARLTANMNYGEHYNLGDWVEFRDEDETSTKVRVDEHIWTYDMNGLRSYPSFVSNEEI